MSKQKTSERLEKALSEYDIENLPEETRRMLDETMGRDDFDPDKLADALERVEAKAQVKKDSHVNKSDRCPWYVALGRISFLLLLTLCIYGLLFAMTMAVLSFISMDALCWLFNNPAVLITLNVVSYLALLFALIHPMATAITTIITDKSRK